MTLLEDGVELRVLRYNIRQAESVVEASGENGLRNPALIEIGSDGHRGGLCPESPLLLEIDRLLHAADCMAGVLYHAGEFYHASIDEKKRGAAENERAKTVRAAQRLREAGYEVSTVSVGSTPTAHFAQNLTGPTEMRAGDYIFFDLVMAGIGVCSVDHIALSVVVTVISRRPDKGWILTDGGWMATSRDRGTGIQKVDQGYEPVAELNG